MNFTENFMLIKPGFKIPLMLFLVTFSLVLFGQNSLLWEISGNGMKDTSYLYGTIHFPNKKYFYVNPKVHEIKSKVDVGVFEIILSQDSLAFISYALIAKEGERLSDICSKQEQVEVFEYLQDNLGMEKLIANNFKPIALTTSILQAFMPPDTTGAVDELFQMDFKRLGKPVVSLESIAFQSKLLTGMPVDEQKKELLDLIHNQDSLVQSIHELDSVYMAQDLKGISVLLDDLKAEEYFSKELLNDTRNLKMIDKIPGIINNQSALICAGAAHLGGELGLLNLLKNRGYIVKPIN